ncbi:hypothetical protein MTO96_017230 [Rhipicephalus appendiculatus]
MTYTPVKSPDATVSYASKHSPEASKKSGEHRSSGEDSTFSSEDAYRITTFQVQDTPIHRSHDDTHQLSLAIKNTRIECEDTFSSEIAVEDTDVHRPRQLQRPRGHQHRQTPLLRRRQEHRPPY